MFLALILSYLLGSLPVGYLVGRYRGIDIRKHGSGNTGTTNAFRILGARAGLVVLAGDVLKGILAVAIGRAAGGPFLPLLCGLLVMAGHNWSIFLGFKGGRGVATGAGAILALAPQVILSALAVWTVVVALSRYVSLGSLVAAGSVPIWMLIYDQPASYVLFGLAAAAVIFYRHRPNIRRLLSGTELKVGQKPR